METLGGSSVCVLRVLEALGGSFVRVLRVREVLGGSFVPIFCVSGRLRGGTDSKGRMTAGGSAEEGLHACGGRGGREGRVGRERVYVFYVSWRLWEAHLYVFYVSGGCLGGPTSNHSKAPGGSPS